MVSNPRERGVTSSVKDWAGFYLWEAPSDLDVEAHGEVGEDEDVGDL
jgi:hypothetical protein